MRYGFASRADVTGRTRLPTCASAKVAGVVLDDSDEKSGQNRPEDKLTNAYDSTSDTAFAKSADGRQEALEGGECTTKLGVTRAVTDRLNSVYVPTWPREILSGYGRALGGLKAGSFGWITVLMGAHAYAFARF